MLGSNVHVTNVIPGPVVTGAGVNALKGDGTKFGVSDNLIATGMSVQRSVPFAESVCKSDQPKALVFMYPSNRDFFNMNLMSLTVRILPFTL